MHLSTLLFCNFHPSQEKHQILGVTFSPANKWLGKNNYVICTV